MHAGHRYAVMFGMVASLATTSRALAETPFLPSAATPQVAARIWMESEPAYYNSGDRLDILYSVPYDSYVAIIHIDSDGVLDFLYPYDPWDDHWVRGGRTYRLGLSGSSAAMRVRGRPGIGYVYIIASPEPLYFGDFFGRNRGWGWDYAGRNVYGDPFLAFEQISRLLLPDWPYARYAYDYHGYYVGGLHRYPNYACGNRRPEPGWGWTTSYGPCGRIDVFLRDQPFYYDTRRYAGDRRGYLTQYDRYDPRHGYKEDPVSVGGRYASPRDGTQPAPQPGVVRDAPAQDGWGEPPRRVAVPAEPSRGIGESPERVTPPATRSPEPAGRAAPPADRAPAPATREPERRTPATESSAPRGSVAPAPRSADPPPSAPASRPSTSSSGSATSSRPAVPASRPAQSPEGERSARPRG